MGKNKKNQEKKKKVNLVFDETKRKDFLCGFRKRKLERKKKAQEELQRLLKEEKKRIKQENKEAYKKLVVSSRPIPDFDKLLEDEYEDGNVNVKIVELSRDSLEESYLAVGQNKPKENVDPHHIQQKPQCVNNSLLGMDSEVESEHHSETEIDDDTYNLKSKQEIKKILKHQATKKIQKSKVFQMKSKLDRVKNKKKAQQKKALITNGKGDSRKEKSKKKGKGDLRKNKPKKRVGKKKH